MKLVSKYDLGRVWPQVFDWLDSAVKVNQGDENIFDVGMALNSGVYELWHEEGKFAAVVQIQHFPRQRVAVIAYAGGDLDAFKKMYSEAKALARERGCSVIRTCGRAGWQRALGLKRVGFILQEQL